MPGWGSRWFWGSPPCNSRSSCIRLRCALLFGCWQWVWGASFWRSHRHSWSITKILTWHRHLKFDMIGKLIYLLLMNMKQHFKKTLWSENKESYGATESKYEMNWKTKKTDMTKATNNRGKFSIIHWHEVLRFGYKFQALVPCEFH